MADATTTTLEEASHCPSCKFPGEANPREQNLGRRGKLITYTCRNERCDWCNTSWVVQVRPDGTIPIRQGGPKEYVNDPYMASMGRRALEQLALEDPTIIDSLHHLDPDQKAVLKAEAIKRLRGM
jgi:hypothetical protein